MTLEQVFNAETLARLKRNAEIRKQTELCWRFDVLTASGVDVSGNSELRQPRANRAQRAAWSNYVDAAAACGLFEGDDGTDLVTRMRSPEVDNFRGAMGECITAWLLAGRQKLKVERPPAIVGRKRSDLVAFAQSARYFVETKSPYREMTDDTWIGNDADALEGAISLASKQLLDVNANIVVLVPQVRDPIYRDREQLEEAVYGQQATTFQVNRQTGEVVGEPRSKFIPNGKFLRFDKSRSGPRHTRVGAVVVIEELYTWFTDHAGRIACTVEPIALVAHNPFAAVPIDRAIFCGLPECIQVGSEMRWTDRQPFAV